VIDSAWSAAAWGAGFGLLNGALARSALQGALNKADKVFYARFALGLFWRLVFLAGAVWLLRDKKYIILLSFTGALIFTQFIFGIIPLQKGRHQPGKNSIP
jgi:hypothetical protein